MHACAHHKRNLMCSPMCTEEPDVVNLILSYNNARVLYEIIEYKDRKDLIAKKNKFQEGLLKSEAELRGSGNYYAMAFAAGPCTMCDTQECNKHNCHRPFLSRMSLCSTGIDLKHLTMQLLCLSQQEALSYWKLQLPQEYFVETDDKYLCLGLILY